MNKLLKSATQAKPNNITGAGYKKNKNFSQLPTFVIIHPFCMVSRVYLKTLMTNNETK